MIGIYILLFPNSKVYIGQSKNVERRFKEYKNGNSQVIHRAIRKYGYDNVKREILVSCNKLNQKQLDFFEKFWIKVYNSTDNNYGYNISPGGNGNPGLSGKNHPNFGKKLSIDTIEKIRLKSIGRKHSIETCRKISKGNIGRKMTEINKEILRKIHTNKIVSQETREKIRRANIGRISKFKGKTYNLSQEQVLEKRLLSNTRKIILQYDLNGNFIKEWNSIREVAKYFKVSHSDIAKNRNNNHRSVRGYLWVDKILSPNYEKIRGYVKRSYKKNIINNDK